MTRSHPFRDTLQVLRMMAPGIPAYDVALMLACARAIHETRGVVAASNSSDDPAAPSIRTIAYNMAHSVLLDSLCQKHGLGLVAPATVVKGPIDYALPSIARFRDLFSLLKMDYRT